MNQIPTQMPEWLDILIKVGIALFAGLLTILGGYFGVVSKIRLERHDEINYIKICLTDEIQNMRDVIGKLLETYNAAHYIHTQYFNDLINNTTNFNDHRKRIYIINDEALRRDIFGFYRNLIAKVNTSRNQVTVQTVPQVRLLGQPAPPPQQQPNANQQIYQVIITDFTAISATAEGLIGRINAYSYHPRFWRF